jgi:pimeloyl-ACP methyl ester carboxylesterase
MVAGQLPALGLEAKALGPERARPVVVPLLGHFGPFQRPAEIANDIANWAEALRF